MSVSCAILGSGNIGVDLLVKLLKNDGLLKPVAMAGIDPASMGLRRASEYGVRTSSRGLCGLLKDTSVPPLDIVFDATTASAHTEHASQLKGVVPHVVDLTPAALGPFVVPTVNLEAHLDDFNVNMVTCGGQATIPIVHAIASAASVRYAEIVASIASRSAGPGTRANIDEFTQTTARAIENIGGAGRGKAIIILNPAEPPIIMRDTVFALVDIDADPARIETAVEERVRQVRKLVPGYHLKQPVQFATQPASGPWLAGLRVSVFLEVDGAGDYLPRYAGNLDIMTCAAVAVGERIAQKVGRAQ